jgi:hypothetical protein
MIFTVYELGCEKMVSYLFHLRHGAKFNVQRGERCLDLTFKAVWEQPRSVS